MPPADNESKKIAEANGILRKYMFGAFSAQAIAPLPFLNKPMQVGLQLNLVRALASLFDVPFERTHVQAQIRELVGASSGEIALNLLRDVVIPKNNEEKISEDTKALLGELTSGGVQKAADFFLKATIPGARLVIGCSELIELMAELYGIGQIFIDHFDCGGTIWTLQIAAVKEKFEQEVENGKNIIRLEFGHGDC